MMPDHVHLLLSIPPKLSVSSFMGYLKGKSALMMFEQHANLKYKFGNRHFWSEGYYVSTVGMNETTIKKYIQDQEKHDQAVDKLSVREHDDPFKGRGKKVRHLLKRQQKWQMQFGFAIKRQRLETMASTQGLQPWSKPPV